MNAFTDKMAARLELWPVNKLIAYEFNAKTHSPEQVEKIAASIAQFGFNAPILVDQKDNTIIAGHGRLMAAQRLGMTEVPVIPLAHMTEAQRRAYILADNKLAEESTWDTTLLAHELAALGDEAELDLGLLGFNEAELADLLGGDEPQTQPAPDFSSLSAREELSRAIVQPGDDDDQPEVSTDDDDGDDLVSLVVGGDQSKSGAKVLNLSIGPLSVPMTEAEAQAMTAAVEKYVDEFGTHYGFASWLLEGRDHVAS